MAVLIEPNKFHNQHRIKLDGQVAGYAAAVPGADVAIVIPKELISQSELGQIARALDEYDNAPAPDRVLNILGREVKAREVTTYA